MALLMKNEMETVGRTLSSWQAQLKTAIWASGIMICLWVFGLSDVFMQFGRPGRVVTCFTLLALAGVAVWRVRVTLAQKHTVLGVAATIEKAFPRLDNHLINYIQFGAATDSDVFKKAYVRRGVPEWSQIDIQQMRNRKAHLIANLVLAGVLVLLAIPGVLTGRTWVISLWRIVNPFSNIAPVSLTHIMKVDPGDATLLQGVPAVLTCTVKGRKGHHVWLDLKPSDNDKTTYDLGRITTSDDEPFPYRIPKLTTGMEYRFRAGDSPFPKWYKIEARPPLAFTQIKLAVVPPSYTRLKPNTFDGMGEPVEVFQGSEASVTVTCNLPLTNATLLVKGMDVTPLVATKDDKVWSAKTVITGGNMIKFSADSKYGEHVEFPVNFELMPDREPVIQILSPAGRTTLKEGGVPAVQFSVQDDYGLSEVWIERFPAGAAKQTVGEVVGKWPCSDFTLSKDWVSENLTVEKGEPIILRVVAKDGYPFGDRRTQSSSIVFDMVNVTNAMQKEALELAAAAASLGKIIEMQRVNVAETTKLKDAVALANAEQWAQVAEVQATIRELTGKILQSPLNPLGGMTAPVKKLHQEEMNEVITTLKDVPTAKGDDKPKAAEAGLALEEAILKKLTYTEAVADKSKTQKKVSGLVTMLENLIKGETKVLAGTEDYVKQSAPVGKPLVDQQDGLAADVAEFIKACQEEATAAEGTDKKFSEMMAGVAAGCEEKAIKQDMLVAAEKLDANAGAAAVPLEQSAIAKLKELEQSMNKWQVTSAENRLAEVIETVQETRDKMDKLAKLTGKVVESMLLTEKNQDKMDKAVDLMEEEAKELQANMKDALLQVPTDLQIFPELSVANEMVDNVIQGFEEVEQVAGSEKWGADKMVEIATLKPESIIDAMAKAKDRLDAVDMWLKDEPDTMKWNSEAFDREEMPKMALGALPSTAEDIIGDLIKSSEELEKAAEDAATNQGAPDVPPGWEVEEGNIESFGAQGKAGNQAPDHKESGGRGNMGRQGMATGEAAASAGTIGEGDPNIEERITPDPLQAGQVQADGEADTKATGGGKMGSGSADGVGMSGGGKDRRMDATSEGSIEGLQALMSKTDAMYVKASLMNLRTDSLATAAHHMRQAEDAIAEGLPISQVRGYEKKAIAALKKAKTELGSGVSDSVEQEASVSVLEDVVDGGTDIIPSNYRDLVSEYYKSLGEAL